MFNKHYLWISFNNFGRKLSGTETETLKKTGWKSSLSWWHGRPVTMGNFPYLELLLWLEGLMPKMPKMPTVGWKEKNMLSKGGWDIFGWSRGRWWEMMWLYAAYDMEPEHDFFQRLRNHRNLEKKGTSDLQSFLKIKDISGFKKTCSCSWSYIHLGSDLVIILT